MKRNFKKLSNVEHVRLRTGMWLGQNSTSLFEQHFFDKQKDDSYKIDHREIEEVPAKIKCIDEACMNAIDEFNRNLKDRSISPKHKMKSLDVSLSADLKRITIKDDGRGIPAQNAEQVFLHLMYGENFDDELKKEHVAGQNGVGISLVRIVSSYFKVETHNRGKCFQKTFTATPTFKQGLLDLKINPTVITSLHQYIDEYGTVKGFKELSPLQYKKVYALAKQEKMLSKTKASHPDIHGTLIEFELDPQYFNDLDMRFDTDLLKQYLQDLAMTNPGLTVYFRCFKEAGRRETTTYFFKKGLEDIFLNYPQPCYKMNYINPKTNFELSSFIVGGSGKNLSWVNSNFSSLGGSSIEFLMNLICDEVRKKPIIASFEKRLKTVSTRNDVRNCLHMYNNFHLIGPRFKSQDKSYLINDLKDDMRNAVKEHIDKMIRKLDLINLLKEELTKRNKIKELDEGLKDLRKANRSIIPKFIPCTSKKKELTRTLFIGEGDSAIAGLRQVRNPAVHGLFPLRGKPLNVRELSLGKAMKNEELKNIISILGLPVEGTLTSTDKLAFERVSIITDADYDGYAIRSLMLNFFFEYWPQLFSLGCIYMTEAPLYEVELENSKKEKKVFYCIDDQEFESLMQKAEKSNSKMLRKKRNKGLGETSQSALAFALEHGMKKITLNQMKSAKKMQNLWFHKKEAALRRKEISSYKQLFLDD